MKISNVKVSI